MSLKSTALPLLACLAAAGCASMAEKDPYERSIIAPACWTPAT